MMSDDKEIRPGVKFPVVFIGNFYVRFDCLPDLPVLFTQIFFGLWETVHRVFGGPNDFT